jgi:hypothetical protein
VVLVQRAYTVSAEEVYVGAVVDQGPARSVAYSRTVPTPQPVAEIVPVLDGQATLVMVSTKPQVLAAEAELRGVGVPVAKSVLLLLLSVQPPLALITASVELGAAVGDVSEQFAVLPYPTKSIILVVGQAPLKAVVELTKATFPADADILIVPETSGVGKAAPVFEADACLIKIYFPEPIVPERFVTPQVVPVALAYCTEYPVRSTAVGPALYSSIKSCV